MGYMTVISILNDGFSAIKENPKEFVDKIEEGISGVKSYSSGTCLTNKNINNYSVGNHANPMWVKKPLHTDSPQLTLSYQNMLVAFGAFNDIEDLELRKKLLEKAKEVLRYEEMLIKKLEENNKK